MRTEKTLIRLGGCPSFFAGRTDNFDGFVMRRPLFASILLRVWNEQRVEEYRSVQSCWSPASAKIPIVLEARMHRSSTFFTRTGALVKNAHVP